MTLTDITSDCYQPFHVTCATPLTWHQCIQACMCSFLQCRLRCRHRREGKVCFHRTQLEGNATCWTQYSLSLSWPVWPNITLLCIRCAEVVSNQWGAILSDDKLHVQQITRVFKYTRRHKDSSSVALLLWNFHLMVSYLSLSESFLLTLGFI